MSEPVIAVLLDPLVQLTGTGIVGCQRFRDIAVIPFQHGMQIIPTDTRSLFKRIISGRFDTESRITIRRIGNLPPSLRPFRGCQDIAVFVIILIVRFPVHDKPIKS